jgi:DNA-binding GntR family transcriptional regulator
LQGWLKIVYKYVMDRIDADPKPAGGSRVDRLYEAVKAMAVDFAIEPGERLNEVALAEQLGASRTPLREALNRLVAEGFLTFQRGRGFFCREFKAREIYELYQLRQILETAAVRLACDAATESELDEIAQYLHDTGPDDGGRTGAEMVQLDEAFHNAIMALTRNEEMAKMLVHLNAKLKYFRWIDMGARRATTQGEHMAIVDALKQRNADLAARLMAAHIERRLDQITAAISQGHSHIPEQSEAAGNRA